MKKHKCDELMLERYHDNELNPEQMRAAMQNIKECRKCAEYIKTLGETEEAVHSILGSLDTETAQETAWTQISRRISSSSSNTRKNSLMRIKETLLKKPHLKIWTTAAAVVLAVNGYLLLEYVSSVKKEAACVIDKIEGKQYPLMILDTGLQGPKIVWVLDKDINPSNFDTIDDHGAKKV